MNDNKKKRTITALNRKIAKCDKCHLNKLRGYGYGNICSSIMFVGQNPGRQPMDSIVKSYEIIPLALNEKPENRPNAGFWFGKFLEHFKLSNKDFYITNTIKCPREDSNDAPKGWELFNCKGFLDAEIELQKPKLIVGLGGPARNAFCLNGFGIPRDDPDGVKIAIWHPGFVNRNGGSNFDKWVQQFDSVKDLLS